MASVWRVCAAAFGLVSLGVAACLLAAGCSARQSSPEYIYGIPNVESVEVVLAPGTPIHFVAVVRGTVRDPCTRIGAVKQALEGRVVTLSLTTRRALADSCSDAETPFEATVPLMERGMQPGEYTVTAGGVSTTFLYRRGAPEL